MPEPRTLPKPPPRSAYELKVLHPPHQTSTGSLSPMVVQLDIENVESDNFQFTKSKLRFCVDLYDDNKGQLHTKHMRGALEVRQVQNPLEGLKVQHTLKGQEALNVEHTLKFQYTLKVQHTVKGQGSHEVSNEERAKNTLYNFTLFGLQVTRPGRFRLHLSVFDAGEKGLIMRGAFCHTKSKWFNIAPQHRPALSTEGLAEKPIAGDGAASASTVPPSSSTGDERLQDKGCNSDEQALLAEHDRLGSLGKRFTSTGRVKTIDDDLSFMEMAFNSQGSNGEIPLAWRCGEMAARQPGFFESLAKGCQSGDIV